MPASKKVSERNPIEQVFNKLLEDIGEEEEFSLPDWLNEGKPTPYTYIKRNVHLTEKTKKKAEDDGIFCTCALSHGSSSVVCGSDCDCGLLNASCSSDCKCGSECNNKPFQQRRVKKLKLIQTDKCGSGIVADEYIQEGEFITEYVGEGDDVILIIEGETRIGIFAISDINKGEHITYDYQFVAFGEDQDCHCGAIGCRKKLGVKPNKPKLVSDEETRKIVASELAQQTLPQVHHNGDIHEGTLINNLSEEQTCPRTCIGVVIRLSRPTSDRCFGIIRRFDEVTRKHSVMFEDGVTEFIDLSKEDWEILSD
ncbi:hypothetical protein YC2023_028741 [Brassica napus]